MPFSNLSPVHIFTMRNLAVRGFLQRIYIFACNSDFSRVVVGEEDDDCSAKIVGELMIVRQKLPAAIRKEWESLDKRQKDLVEALLPVLFSRYWDRAFMPLIDGEEDLYLVWQKYT